LKEALVDRSVHGNYLDLQDFITPLIAAIFQGTNFAELSFSVDGSRFKYGHFINAFIVFIIVLVVLYFGVVMPLQKVRVTCCWTLPHPISCAAACC